MSWFFRDIFSNVSWIKSKCKNIFFFIKNIMVNCFAYLMPADHCAPPHPPKLYQVLKSYFPTKTKYFYTCMFFRILISLFFCSSSESFQTNFLNSDNIFSDLFLRSYSKLTENCFFEFSSNFRQKSVLYGKYWKTTLLNVWNFSILIWLYLTANRRIIFSSKLSTNS